jgi:Helicase associated domain
VQQEALQKTLQRVLLASKSSSSDTSAGESTSAVTAATRFLLEPRREYSREMYQQLCTFVQDHDGKFPYDYTTEQLPSIADKRLLYWCQRQRKDYKAHLQQQEIDKQQEQDKQQQDDPSNDDSIRIMRQDRIQKLEALGFVWDEHDKVWHERYHELKKYRMHHGHCAIPADYPSNPQLGMYALLRMEDTYCFIR